MIKDEDEIIKERPVFAAARGFSFDINKMKHAIKNIGSDCRNGYKANNGMPSSDFVRSWRDTNRDITYRTAKNKTLAKLRAESYDHVNSYAVSLKAVDCANSGIFDEPERMCNVDEKPASADFGPKIKVFYPAKSNHAGAVAQNGGKPSKQVTALVAVSASGRRGLHGSLLQVRILCEVS